ncbi:alpha/beta hydrolase [Priestia filamentosa]|uniref:alpha/beta fold hydrolase n=1 Tax=Priestia filamentosa TaxID=1402861 RepID=UPI0020704699|nr:alpha/beta hydrolase [Priestia filamentosa]UOE61841.1 alpha/beta hydrolase [Priestia filamentosa]
MALYYEEYGDRNASLMVFLHGGGVSGWMWERQIQYFTHYHCLVPNLPEHGTRGSDTPFSIRSSAIEIIKLIEEKGEGKKVIVIGFSLGSQVLLQMLSMKQDLVDVAIINSALVRPLPYISKWVKPFVNISLPLLKKRWFAKLQAKTLYVSERDFETYYKESRQMKASTLSRVLEENMLFTLPEGFRCSCSKILVTVGEKEKEVMKKSARDIVESNPNCKGVFISKMGHGVPLAMPDFFNAMTEEWIKEGTIAKECREIEE